MKESTFKDSKSALEGLIDYLNRNNGDNGLMHSYACGLADCVGEDADYNALNMNFNSDDIWKRMREEELTIDDVLLFRVELLLAMLNNSTNNLELFALAKDALQQLKNSILNGDKSNELNKENKNDIVEKESYTFENLLKIESPKNADTGYELQTALNKLIIPNELQQAVLGSLVTSKNFKSIKLDKFKFDENSTEYKVEDEKNEEEENENDDMKSKEDLPVQNDKNKSIEKKTLEVNHDFIKICKIMARMFQNAYILGAQQAGKAGLNDYKFKLGISDCINKNQNFFQELATIDNIAEYIENIEHIDCKDEEFNNFKGVLSQEKIKLTVKDGCVAVEETSPKKVLPWVLGGVGCLGILISGVFTVNKFVFTFWAAAAATKTAAILSIGIPGGVAIVCFALIAILFYYNKRKKEGSSEVKENLKLTEEEISEEMEEKNKSKEDSVNNTKPPQEVIKLTGRNE